MLGLKHHLKILSRRKAGLMMLLSLWFTVSCTTVNEPSDITARGFGELKIILDGKIPSMKTYLQTGPFSYEIRRNFSIRVTDKEIVNSDLYLSSHQDSAPLVIIQHGNLADKSLHEKQARHLASWGVHVLVVDQPNQDRWTKNGIVLYHLARLLALWPDLLGKRFNPDEIIAVGHSFGGSAVSIAAGKGAPFKGVILLDPAVANTEVASYIKKIRVPVILLGADLTVFHARRRNLFYSLIRKNIAEISVKNATHNDAQFPAHVTFGEMFNFIDRTSSQRQQLFSAAIVTSVFSYVLGNDQEYAWSAFQKSLSAGLLVNPQKK